MQAAREYAQYGITKKRFSEILTYMLEIEELELYSIAYSSDNTIADVLVESIIYNISYERIERIHGLLPISKSDFYRKRRLMFHIADERMKDNE